jgi:hypothetical protein
MRDDDAAPVSTDEPLLRTAAPADAPAVTAASPRLVTWRVVLFVVVLLGVLVAAVLAFRGGASAWKVKLSGNNVAIYKGDKVQAVTPLQVNQFDPQQQVRLRNGVALDSREEAQQYVDGLARQIASTLPTVTSTSTAPTTVTTAPTASTASSAPIGP